MTRNGPQPARAVPARPIVCPCSSASTSFMLSALRAGHVDPSHAPAAIAWIEERPSLTPAPPAAKEVSSTNPQSNRTKKTRRRPRVE
jgi:hypothetical protein